jgi:hypothetical protein
MRITISIETETPTGHVEWSWHAASGEHGKGRDRSVTCALTSIGYSMRDCGSLQCDGCVYLRTRTLSTSGPPLMIYECGHDDAPDGNRTDTGIGKRPGWCPTRGK